MLKLYEILNMTVDAPADSQLVTVRNIDGELVAHINTAAIRDNTELLYDYCDFLTCPVHAITGNAGGLTVYIQA